MISFVRVLKYIRIRLVVRIIGSRFPFALNRIAIGPAKGLAVSVLAVDSHRSLLRLKAAGIRRAIGDALGSKTERIGSRRNIGAVDLINIPAIHLRCLQVGQIVLRTKDGIAQDLLAHTVQHNNYRLRLRVPYLPAERSRSSGDIRGLGMRRLEERIAGRLNGQVIQIEQTRSRLEEHDVLTLRTCQRQLHQIPVVETGRVGLYIIVDGQIGIGIGERIDYVQRRQILRIRQRTYYDRLTVCVPQIGVVHNLTAVSDRTE